MNKLITLITIFTVTAMATVCNGKAVNAYASPRAIQEVAIAKKQTIVTFDNLAAIKEIPLTSDIVSFTQVTLPSHIDDGAHGLKVSFEDIKDGKEGGRLTINIPIDAPIQLTGSRALIFNYYASERLSNYLFGRFDVRIKINGNALDWQMPAVKPNWHELVWDFDDIEAMPSQITSMQIVLGDLLAGYEKEDFIVGPIKLAALPDLATDAVVGEVLAKDKSWANRYVALQSLATQSSSEALALAMQAAGDSSRFIRNTSVDIMHAIATSNLEQAAPVLRQGMLHDNWRVRYADIKLIEQLKGHYLWAAKYLNEGVLDDCYYIRHFCLDLMLAAGDSKAQVAHTLLPYLTCGDKTLTLATLRILGEIGPQAGATVPVMLTILRDPMSPSELRYWALSSVWWVDDFQLTPQDWVIALALNPGEVHRHLLNKAMERLRDSGENAVPVLVAALKTPNPQVRSRAAAILKQMGPAAIGSTAALKEVIKNDKWYLAYEADQALRAIDPLYIGEDITAPKAQSTSQLTLNNNGTHTTISNGVIEMVFENGNDEGGPDIIRRVGGDNLVEGDWLYGTLAIKHSKGANILERKWVQKFWGSPIPKAKEDVKTEVFYQDDQVIDYMVKFSKAGFDMSYEYHYVLEKDRSGYYFYAVTRNESGKQLNDGTSYSGSGTGRMGHLTAITWDAYDYGFLHDNLKRKATFAPSVTSYYDEGYPDIYQCTFRMPNGNLAAKHEWGVHELDNDVVGFAGLKQGGFWCIAGSHESNTQAWPRNEKGNINNNLFLLNIEGKYYVNGCSAVIDKDWEKVSGPFYFYINDGENVEEMWTDAKRQAALERASWPYPWLNSFGYQARGTVQGKLTIAGDHTAGAYVVLSNPINQGDPDQVSVWMRNTGPYIYWAEMDDAGHYTIENVRSGTYGVYAFKPGIFGETFGGQITVKNGKVVNVPDMTINQQSEGQLVWQIGKPDGGAMEFRNGNNYHMWDNFLRYGENFPDDVHYTIGKSKVDKDWNYMQPACAIRGGNKPTTWTVDFDLKDLPANQGKLSIMCGGRSAKTQLFINDQKIGDLNINIGTQHVRSVPYGQQALKVYNISPAVLKKGKNKLEITFNTKRKSGESSYEIGGRSVHGWISYDFLRFEVQ